MYVYEVEIKSWLLDFTTFNLNINKTEIELPGHVLYDFI